MTFERDPQIAALLGHWQAPAATPDAVARIVAAAGSANMQAPIARRRLMFAAPALAAAMAWAVLSIGHYPVAPKTDPLLQQSALGVFSVSQPGGDGGDTP